MVGTGTVWIGCFHVRSFFKMAPRHGADRCDLNSTDVGPDCKAFYIILDVVVTASSHSRFKALKYFYLPLNMNESDQIFEGFLYQLPHTQL